MLVVQQLLSGSERLGAKILLRHTVIDLLKNTDDEVIGVEARRGRQTRLIGARKGVVFATGGFLHNTRLVADFLRAPVLGEWEHPPRQAISLRSAHARAPSCRR